MNEHRVITIKGFLERFLDQHIQRPEHPFFFILGAGASKPSGIPTGEELTRQWVEEIWKAKDFEKLLFEQWATADRLEIKNFTLESCADFYPEIYEKRFGDHPEEGYAFLESIIDGKEPSYGYAVLAYLISETDHRIVITTNFDNLVADALSIHSTKFPLVIGHDSLTVYASIDPRRPLIAKIHGAVGFAPKNKQDEIRHLPDVWQKPLEGIFSRCTPIVIGYGGNDGSLMGFLEGLSATVPDNIYWCMRTNESNPETVWRNTPERIRNIIIKKKGYLVPIPGFDELMLLLSDHVQEQLLIPDLYLRLQDRARRREESFDNQIKVLYEVLGQKRPTAMMAAGSEAAQPLTAATGDEEVSTLLQGAASRLSKSRPEKPWWQWMVEIDNEIDPDKQNALYEVALDSLPMSSPLLDNYAIFLSQIRKEYGRAEEFYHRALEADPHYLPTRVALVTGWAGGVGKSTLSLGIAKRFRERNLPTAILEASAGGSYLVSRLGPQLHSLYDVITGKDAPSDWHGVKLYPQDYRSSRVLEDDPRLSEFLAGLRRSFTLTVVDASPDHPFWPRLLDLTTTILIVTVPREDSLFQAETLLKELQPVRAARPDLQVHLIMNMVRTLGERIGISGMVDAGLPYNERWAAQLDPRLFDPILNILYPGRMTGATSKAASKWIPAR